MHLTEFVLLKKLMFYFKRVVSNPEITYSPHSLTFLLFHKEIPPMGKNSPYFQI